MLSAVAALVLIAQKPTPAQPASKSNPRLVEVNVVVRDKNGPVAGLTQKDFTLLDKGKEQQIASFVVSNNQGIQPQNLGPNVFGNRLNIGAPPSGVTVILLDTLDTDTQLQTFVRAQVLKAVADVKPEDRIVLAVLGDRLHVLSDLGAPAAQESSLEQWMVSNSVPGGMDILNQLHNATDALVTIAGDMSSFAGRKNLLWIAGLFPASVDHYGAEGPPGLRDSLTNITAAQTSFNSAPNDPTNIDRGIFQKTFNAAAQALNFASVSIYEVDARGLSNVAASTSANVRGSATSTIPLGTGALRVMAEDSGGRAAENSNDVLAAIRQAINDAQVTYTLGFYPDAKSLDSQFHSLKVQVGRPGVDLLYRKGYVAWPETKNASGQHTDAIKNALLSPLEVDGIGLLGGYQKVDQPKPGSMKVTVMISVADLQLQQKGDEYTGEIEVVLTPRSADGKDRGTVRQPLGIKLSQQQYETVLKQGLAFPTTLQTTGEVAELRAVVCDHMSGRLGSLIMPVK